MNEIKIDRLIHSRRRSIGLQIAPDATLIVRAPLFATLRDVQRVVHDKRHWIVTKQEMVRERMALKKNKEFIQGEDFLYLGKTYLLELVKGLSKPVRLAENIRVSGSEKENVKSVLIKWYKAEALKIITERVGYFATRNGLQVKSVKISNAKKRWGSCGPSGGLNFNWRLIMAPLFVLDYVVAHELAHVKIRNHSKYFWQEVATIIPEYKKAERWLKENHFHLEL